MNEERGAPARGFFQSYRRNIEGLERLERNRAEQIRIWGETRDKVRELRMALSGAYDAGASEKEIVALKQLVKEWEELAIDAEKYMQFLNGERDRQVAEHRANISLGLSGVSLLLAIAGFSTALCVAIFK